MTYICFNDLECLNLIVRLLNSTRSPTEISLAPANSILSVQLSLLLIVILLLALLVKRHYNTLA